MDATRQQFSVSQLPANWQSKIIEFGGCWMWIGARNSRGYGCVGNGKGGSELTHRGAYELLVGPIPEGLQIDHLCRVIECCNPEHLEPVTQLVNIQRGSRAMKTHCKRGHPLSGDNLRIAKARGGQTRRNCRTCQRERTSRPAI